MLWHPALLLGLVFSGQLAPLNHLGTLTDGLRSPARIAIAADGTVLVTDPYLYHIARFRPDGTLIGTWPVAECPVGVAVHPDGRYFVSYRDDARVGIYDAAFTRIGFLGEGLPPVAFVRPTDIDVAVDTGQIYVVDSGADRIYAFESGGGLAVMFGERGESLAQFRYPSALGVDVANGRIIVADHDNFRVQVFTSTGVFLQRFGYRNKYTVDGQEGWMPRTQGVAVDARGYIYVADALMSTVRIFNSSGVEVGKVVEYGNGVGNVRTPCDVALSPDGTRLYVVSTNTPSVEVYLTPNLAAVASASAGAPNVSLDPPGTNDSAFDVAYRRGQPTGDGWLSNGKKILRQPTRTFSPIQSSGGIAAVTVAASSYDGPHVIDGSVVCGRCHGIVAQPGVHPGTLEGQTELCFSCHSSGGQAMHMPLSEQDIVAGSAPGRSHPWGVAAINEAHGSTGPTPGGEMNQYLDGGVRIKCSTCHNQHSNEIATPYLRRSNADGGMCKECHTARTDHTPSSAWHPDCNECHQPHGHTNANLSLVATSINNLTLGTNKPVVFTALSGPGSFDDGDPAANDGVCQVCHTATSYHRHDATGVPHNDGQTCTTCHPHSAGFLPSGGACDSCHGAPPLSGAHLTHFGGVASAAAYGGTENLSAGTTYVFQCGQCHPLSSALHRNGTVDVELHNAGAPPGTLKSLSPPTATYTPGGTVHTDVNGLPYTLGTCANVYCHSATEWSYPGVVSDPLMDPVNGWAALDANGNLTYQPYTVGVSTRYATVNWGGLPQGCNDCHRNMPQTSYPNLQAGVGNSHGWIDDWGYENYHAWNMGFDPLTCRVCHYDTVKNDMTWTRDGMGITFFDDVAIDDKTYHVNGVKDVRFDTLDPVIYPTSGGMVTFSLAATTYSPQTRVCSNTPCHLEQTSPEWGKPYRWWDSLECDQCHRYGGPWPPAGPNATAQATEKGGRVPASRLSVNHSELLAESCTECHVGHRRTP